MTKLTTEITIEELQYRINAHENDLTQMWTADYFLNVQKELLALKQAAKNPVAWVATDSEDFPEYNSQNEFSAGCGAGTPLYAAPVLPKQPELMSIGELLHRLEEQTGEKWVEESEQSVIPDEINSAPDYVKALTKEGAYIYGWNECRAEMLKAQPVIPDEIIPDQNNSYEYVDGWNACRAEMLKAQPVSEPYKLPQGWIKGQFAYQDLFNAIGAAVVSKHPSIEISVKAFEDSMLAAAPAQESE